jgi:hypothetical protein
MWKDVLMRISRLARLALASSTMALFLAAALSAQTALPTRKPVAQVNLKANEPYYLDTFKADIDRLESGLNSASGQKTKLESKDKLNILLDTIDTMLFRQYCDREGIKVSDSDVSNQIAQYRSAMGSGATDSMVEAALRRNGVFTDMKSYFKQELLFTAYLKAKKTTELKAIGQPSADDILKAYGDMKFNLRRPSSYRFTMLVAKTQGKSEADKKKAADTMKSIALKVKANPSAFEQCLLEGSLESAAAGYQTMIGATIAKTAESKKAYPNLYDAVFQLKEGETSDMIEEPDQGYIVVRVNEYLPEKQLGLDDYIEGLPTKAATANPYATVLALVANEYQSSKYSALQSSARAEISAKLRKEAMISVNAANLAGILDEAEINAVKALKGSGYNIVAQ